ncbi:hypothetical protein LINPERHAP1_LOCUS38751 [Linum perenne]
MPAVPAANEPQLTSQSIPIISPCKEFKRAKTLEGEGMVKRYFTQHGKNICSLARTSHVNSSMSFHDTVMGDIPELSTDQEDTFHVSDESDDEGDDDPGCPTVRVPFEEKL